MATWKYAARFKEMGTTRNLFDDSLAVPKPIYKRYIRLMITEKIDLFKSQVILHLKGEEHDSLARTCAMEIPVKFEDLEYCRLAQVQKTGSTAEECCYDLEYCRLAQAQKGVCRFT